MSEDRIRVIAPDVGGGFGVKISHYPEEILAAGRRASSAGPSSGPRRARST